MRTTPGTFTNATTVRLRTGHTIIQVTDNSAYTKTPHMTGWLAGTLYVSRDNGATWGPSDIGFGG